MYYAKFVPQCLQHQLRGYTHPVVRGGCRTDDQNLDAASQRTNSYTRTCLGWRHSGKTGLATRCAVLLIAIWRVPAVLLERARLLNYFALFSNKIGLMPISVSFAPDTLRAGAFRFCCQRAFQLGGIAKLRVPFGFHTICAPYWPGLVNSHTQVSEESEPHDFIMAPVSH